MQIARLIDKIRTYDKENLDEMLFAAGEGIRLIAGTERVRIYLEDLTRLGTIRRRDPGVNLPDNLRSVSGLPGTDDRQAGRVQRQSERTT
jgi:hypothetical protein